MGSTFIKMIGKLTDILSTAFGWIVGVLIFLLNAFLEYISGHEVSILVVLFVVVLDAGWAIARAVQDDKYTTSSLMRDSISKLSVYGTLLLAFIGFDKVGGFDSGVPVTMISALIILVEVWSIIGNILIVIPDFPVLHLLRKQMVGEMANKLGCDPDEVEDALTKRQNK